MQELADRLEILELFPRYAHTYDEGRLDRLGELFTEDATFEIHGSIGAMPAVMEGRQGIVEHMSARYRETRPAQRRHIITNVVIEELTADTARIAAYLLLGTTSADQLSLPVTGRYTDDLRKVDGRWRIHRQVLRLDAALA